MGSRGRHPRVQWLDHAPQRHRPQRHVNCEYAAIAGLAFYAYVPAVEPGEATREGETKAGALLLAVDPGIDLLKLVEDPRLVGLGDADAGVPDRDLSRVGQPLAGDEHRTALGRELDCVGNQVQEHLLELGGVSLNLA